MYVNYFCKKNKFGAILFIVTTVILIFFVDAKALENSFAFTQKMKLGDYSFDVKALQELLNKDIDTAVALTGAGSLGFETNYFGQKTKDAVMRFQSKYSEEVLIPAGIYIPTGFVGEYTIKKLNSLLAKQDVISNTTTTSVNKVEVFDSVPVIESFSRNAVFNGETITIEGQNFSKDTEVVLVSDIKEYLTPKSVSSDKIVFDMDTALARSIKDSLDIYRKIPEAFSVAKESIIKKSNFKKEGDSIVVLPYFVSVLNSAGSSASYQVSVKVKIQ